MDDTYRLPYKCMLLWMVSVFDAGIMSTSKPKRHLSNTIPSWLVLMGLLTALGPLAVDMYLPAFPQIAVDLATSEGRVERTLASYLFGMALAQLFYGPIADRFGRKPPLIFGVLLFSIASIAVALSQDIEHLTLWRIVQAFGGASGAVIPRAVIRDHLETRDAAKALSMIMLIMGATPILAPIIGGQVLLFADWRFLFHIMTLCGAALLISTLFTMKESLDKAHTIPLRPKLIAKNYKELLQHRSFLLYSLVAAFGSAGMFAYISGAPRVFISAFEVPITWFGALFGLNAFCLIAASQIGVRLLKYYLPHRILAVAQTIQFSTVMVGLVCTLLGIMNVYGVMAMLMVFMACQGFINPNAAALALSAQGHRLGVASALMGTLQMLCGALSGLAVSSWHTISAVPLVAVLSACVTISWFSGRKALKEMV